MNNIILDFLVFMIKTFPLLLSLLSGGIVIITIIMIGVQTSLFYGKNYTTFFDEAINVFERERGGKIEEIEDRSLLRSVIQDIILIVIFFLLHTLFLAIAVLILPELQELHYFKMLLTETERFKNLFK